MSDGLLGDLTNVQFICTFNGPEQFIDQALLRKGRLIKKYKFELLSAEKAQKLSNSLGLTETITEPMSLADIYNYAQENGYKQKTYKRVGFL